MHLTSGIDVNLLRQIMFSFSTQVSYLSKFNPITFQHILPRKILKNSPGSDDILYVFLMFVAFNT